MRFMVPTAFKDGVDLYFQTWGPEEGHRRCQLKLSKILKRHSHDIKVSEDMWMTDIFARRRKNLAPITTARPEGLRCQCLLRGEKILSSERRSSMQTTPAKSGQGEKKVRLYKDVPQHLPRPRSAGEG